MREGCAGKFNSLKAELSSDLNVIPSSRALMGGVERRQTKQALYQSATPPARAVLWDLTSQLRLNGYLESC